MLSNREYLSDGREVYTYNIADDMGTTATILSLGAIVQSLSVQVNGKPRQVVLGYDTADEYLRHNYYMGCVVGRVAGRIPDAKANIDGTVYELSDNSDGIHLHGGVNGFNTKCFELIQHTKSSVTLGYFSPAGEGGYPADLTFRVQYSLENCSLIVKYYGNSTASTLLCPTQHSYFLLSEDNIYNHKLQIDADSIYELNDKYLRTGRKLSVENTPFDFRSAKYIKSTLDEQHQQLKLSNGIDHSYVLNSSNTTALRKVATLSCDDLAMDCITNMNILHLYSGNFLDTHTGRDGKMYSKHSGICLEFQDTLCDGHGQLLNSAILHSNQQYNKKVIYKFYTA